MTAINVILTHDSAHVITDGAITDSTGRMIMVGAKVFSFPHIGAAVAVRGHKDIGLMIADFVSKLGASFDEVKSRLVGKLTEFLAKPESHQQLEPIFGSGWNELDIVVAGWSEALRSPNAYFVVTHDKHPGVPPLKIMETGRHFVAPTHPAMMAEIEMQISSIVSGELGDESLDEFSADLIERQMQIESNVGAFAQVTTITHSDITSRIAKRFVAT